MPKMIHVSIDNELHYNLLQPSDFIFNIEVAKNQYQLIIEESLVFDPPLPFEQFTEPFLENRFVRIRANPWPLKVSDRATLGLEYRVSDPAHLSEPLLPVGSANAHGATQIRRPVAGLFQSRINLPKDFAVAIATN